LKFRVFGIKYILKLLVDISCKVKEFEISYFLKQESLLIMEQKGFQYMKEKCQIRMIERKRF
jgi:hypothetical protein